MNRETWIHSRSNALLDGQTEELDQKPTEALILRALSVHHACRIISGMVQSRVQLKESTDTKDVRDATYRTAKLAALQATAAQSSVGTTLSPTIVVQTPTAQAAFANTVNVNEVADAAQSRQVHVMDSRRYLLMFPVFEKVVGRPPKAGEINSPAQLSVLEAILSTGTCLVDLALWGEFANRGAKAMKVLGQANGPSGYIVPHEFKGPPDIEAFVKCWDNFTCGMVTLEEAPPTYLNLHRDRMQDWQTLYGPKVWAFQYQCHYRFVGEHMPLTMMMEAQAMLDAMIAANSQYVPNYRNGEFDPAKPWAYIWYMATSHKSPTTAEWHWWDQCFRGQAEMIVHGVSPETRFLGGEAPVAKSSQEHFALAHNANAINNLTPWGAGGGGVGGRGAGGGKAIVDDKGAKGKGKDGGKDGKAPKGGDTPLVYVANAKHKKLCNGYQNGSCKSKWLTKENKYDCVCPASKELRHQCNLCLSYDHGGLRCDMQAKGKKRKRGKNIY